MDWLLTLCVIATSVLAAKAFFRARALSATILALKASVEVLDQRVSRFENPPASMPEAPLPEAPLPEEAIGESTPFRAQASLLPALPVGKSWEEMLVENWLVWLGGVALALGGAFLVKLSIDYGLLIPAVRVALGVLLGLALWAGAEWSVWGEAASRPSNVSQALAASGAATIFASLYAAYQLYLLLPPALAFPLLALTAAVTVLMSLQHGPFVAVLGLAGAFAVPAMVSSEQPSALALFTYLILVGAGSLALLRHRAWWWLAWIALAGSIGWALLWLALLYDPADVWVVGGYLLAQIGLFTPRTQKVTFTVHPQFAG